MGYKKYKQKQKKKFKYKIILGISAFFAVILLLFIILISPLGNKIVKSQLEKKFNEYVPGTKIVFLDYGLGSFSLEAIKANNLLKVYGEYYPIDAIFEADINGLESIVPYLQGKMKLNGKVFVDQYTKIEGKAYFAKGVMSFFLRGKDKSVEMFSAQGNSFSLADILYMLKIPANGVNAKASIFARKDGDTYNVSVRSKGEYSDGVKALFNGGGEFKLKDFQNNTFLINVNSNIGTAHVRGETKSGLCKCNYEVAKLNLNALRAVLKYPFNGKVDIKGSYESENGVIKFIGENFEGFYDSKIEITFAMPAEKFFHYVNLENILKGKVSGTLAIVDQGKFDIVVNDAVFYETPLVKKIKRITGIDLSKEKIGKIFLKGTFDSKMAVFDMLSTNKKIAITIKKGKFIYPNGYDLYLFVRKNSDIYKIRVKNNTLKVIERKEFRGGSNKVLVF